MKRKVFHLVTTLEAGAVTRHLLTLLGRLDRERWEVSLGYLRGAGESSARFRDLELPVSGFRMRRGVAALAPSRLKSHLRDLRPDIVHTHLSEAHLYGGPAGRSAGVRAAVATVHVVESLRSRRHTRRALAGFDAVITGTDALADELAGYGGVPSGRVRRIRYGLDVAAFEGGIPEPGLRRSLGLPDEVKLVVSPAHGTPQEDLADIVLAAEHASHQFPEAVFLLVGAGERELRRTRRLIRRRRLTHTVLMTGLAGELEGVLYESDIFVLGAGGGTRGVLLLEAMAAGLPVVAARSAETEEIVLNEATGLLVPPRSSEALSEALARLLRAPELGRMMGKAGRLRVRTDFSAQRMVNAVERLYDELLSEGPEERP